MTYVVRYYDFSRKIVRLMSKDVNKAVYDK